MPQVAQRMRTLTLNPTVCGPDVAAWQQFLKKRHVYRSHISGVFGPETFQATVAFQGLNGLNPDGTVSQLTWDKAFDHGFLVAHHLIVESSPAANRPSYDLNDHIAVPEKMQPIVDEIAHAFLAQTGRRLRVTSGTRSAESQAEAMRRKLDLNDDVKALYADHKAVQEIIDAYNSASTAAARDQAMTETIKKQIARGVLISDHLTGEAVDFRDLSPHDAKVLDAIIKERGGLWVKHEKKPHHIHIQIQHAKVT